MERKEKAEEVESPKKKTIKGGEIRLPRKDLNSVTSESVVFNGELDMKKDKRAFLFPGQGVKVPDIIAFYKSLRDKDQVKSDNFIFILQSSLTQMNRQANFRVSSIMNDENASAWNRTDFAQPLIYTLSVLTFELMENRRADFMLGHSLGAFSALTAAGVLPFDIGCAIVAMRGKLMQEESLKANSGMRAIVGLSETDVKKICADNGTEIVLKNAPTAFVIGGTRDILDKIGESIPASGRTFMLSTPGAFHSKAMFGAYEKFRKYLEKIEFQTPLVPVVTSIDGKAMTDAELLKRDVVESMIKPVNWIRMMEFLKNRPVSSYVEIGPGTSMISLCRLNGIEREKTLHA